MFKLSLSPMVWATGCKVEWTTDEGRKVESKFDVQFKRLGLKEMRDLTERNRSGELPDELFIHEVVNNWRGITGEDGGELEFCAEELDKAIDKGLGQVMLQAFFDTFPKAKAKN